MKVLLDSVILIDHFNGVAEASAYLRLVYSAAAISVITRAEVLTGFSSEAEPKGRRLLDVYPVLAVTKEIADLAARLRREHRWKLPDALQAAVAQTHQLTLATRNTKDFPPGQFAFVTVPYELGGLVSVAP